MLEFRVSNPIYIGQIRHKDKIYEGQHEGIIPESLWLDVQNQLKNQATVNKGARISRHTNLLKGLLFDEEGTIYTPSYTMKAKKQYRYYISQNVIRLKNKLEGVLARIPAQEIEVAVEAGIRNQFANGDQVSTLFNLDFIEDIETIQVITNLHRSIPFASMTSDCIERIIIKRDVLEIYIKMGCLRKLTSDVLKRALPEGQNDEIRLFQVSYKTVRQKAGAIVIEPEDDDNDPFDLPPAKLQKFIQGVIWRDEHFGGMTLKDIAHRENCSEAYVGTAIFSSFDILEQALSSPS